MGQGQGQPRAASPTGLWEAGEHAPQGSPTEGRGPGMQAPTCAVVGEAARGTNAQVPSGPGRERAPRQGRSRALADLGPRPPLCRTTVCSAQKSGPEAGSGSRWPVLAHPAPSGRLLSLCSCPIPDPPSPPRLNTCSFQGGLSKTRARPEGQPRPPESCGRLSCPREVMGRLWVSVGRLTGRPLCSQGAGNSCPLPVLSMPAALCAVCPSLPGAIRGQARTPVPVLCMQGGPAGGQG